MLKNNFDPIAFAIAHPKLVKEALELGITNLEEYWFRHCKPQGIEAIFVSPEAWRANRKQRRISVVMPAYNEELYLEEAVNSVLEQSELDIELIIVDDGSKDDTAKIMRELARKDSRIVNFFKKNGGTGSALNLGFKYANGIYQTWFSADNILKPRALEQLSRALDLNAEAVLAYSDFAILEQDTGKYTVHQPEDFNLQSFRRSCYLGNCWLFRSEIKKQVGEYSLKLCEDYDMHLRMAQEGPFVHVPKVLGVWRGHSKNLSNSVCAVDGWRDAALVQARNQWQVAKVKIFHISLSEVASHSGWHLLQGISQRSDQCAMRRLTFDTNLETPGIDLTLPKDQVEVENLLKETSVIHLNIDTKNLNNLSVVLKGWSSCGIPIILHIHGSTNGSAFNFSELEIQKVKDAIQKFSVITVVCSVPDITKIIPNAIWMPELLPIDNLSGYFDEKLFSYSTKNLGMLELALTSPDDQMQVTQVYQELERENLGRGGLAFSYIPLFSHTSNQQDTYRKRLEKQRQATCLIDLNNSHSFTIQNWEALAQGLILVKAIDPYAKAKYEEIFNGNPPPYIAVNNKAELKEQLLRLIKDPPEATRLSHASREWMINHLAAQKVLEMYGAIYLKAGEHSALRDYGVRIPKVNNEHYLVSSYSNLYFNSP